MCDPVQLAPATPEIFYATIWVVPGLYAFGALCGLACGKVTLAEHFHALNGAWALLLWAASVAVVANVADPFDTGVWAAIVTASITVCAVFVTWLSNNSLMYGMLVNSNKLVWVLWVIIVICLSAMVGAANHWSNCDSLGRFQGVVAGFVVVATVAMVATTCHAHAEYKGIVGHP